MSLPKRCKPSEFESRLQDQWEMSGIHRFSGEGGKPIFSIDSPPATVSGYLHLGHCYSYSQTDFMARFWRMNGYDVFYPMGFDDNGLPTERLVERTLGINARDIGRDAFILKCLELSEEYGGEYRALWQRLGLSIDWRHTYRTIDDLSRRSSQLSFLDLYHKGLVYRDLAPSIWCPECGTALAQADLEDLERERLFYTLAFQLEDGSTLPIATTRPEMLPACVAIFIHPDDDRFHALRGHKARVPLMAEQVPILEDPAVDKSKGTGVVMCCTFGDTADIEWWRKHDLPLKMIVDQTGRMTDAAGEFRGVSIEEARRWMIDVLEESGWILDRQKTAQVVSVHERCDTPVEYLVTRQWLIRILEFKEQLLEAGQSIAWHPSHMQKRYQQWVENLNWDWLISRQRFYGVPFPVWYCERCDGVVVADETRLPVDPLSDRPSRACECGGESFLPEMDVMDTWATSSLTPQIACGWLSDKALYERLFPMSLRPQAHEIIRTWAFYTIVKSMHHFGEVPWRDVAISGWGTAPEGAGKISKSRGGGPVAPVEMIERYSADAVRYWAACTGFGKDSVISEDKIRVGSRLVTKLWNVARFSEAFLCDYQPPPAFKISWPTDRWMLSRTQRVMDLSTEAYRNYDYVTAKNETENLFWHDLADNYLEMVKYRLYGKADRGYSSARFTLYHTLLNILKLFAPLLPHVTDEIFRAVFAECEATASIHQGGWPQSAAFEIDEDAERFGELMVQVVTAVRRYKSERHLALSTDLVKLQIAVKDPRIEENFRNSTIDLRSATRAKCIEIVQQPSRNLHSLIVEEAIELAIDP
jgi:valyl-tRNA synthetase